MKGYKLKSFAKDMNKNLGKNMSKILCDKCSQNFSDHTWQPVTDAIKNASKTLIQKPAEATGDFIGNKLADKITQFWRSLPQNTSGNIESEAEKVGFDREETKRKIYISEKKAANFLYMIMMIIIWWWSAKNP